MEDATDGYMRKEFFGVWVRDPKIQKDDFWHTHLEYEICLHTNSMCFRKKTSCVRRRYSEFVWLRQRLQANAPLLELPKLPPWNPFFSQTNECHVNERMKGLQHFLEAILQIPLLLSDSRLHLFLQSQLSIAKMEACASGLTRYTVAQAIQRCACETRRFPSEEELRELKKPCCDSDCDSTSSTGPGGSSDPGTPQDDGTPPEDPPPRDCQTVSGPGELFSCLSTSSFDETQVQP